MIDVKRATESIARLGMLKFFPADAAVRTEIVLLACRMAATNEQIDWTVSHALNIWNEWQGPRELRAVLCSKYKPADGIEAYSALPQFADGIPSEDPARNGLLSPPAPVRQLSGDVAEVSDSPSFQRTVLALAAAKAMERRKPAKVPEIPINRLTPENQITQADIDRAVQELRDKRARAELDGAA